MQKISRQKTIEGTRIPGIIKNMQYHYINLDVYEDGMINCWELVDLKGLKEKIEINWLVPNVPNGEILSIFGLGAYKIKSARWNYDKKSYYMQIKNTIEKLNPKMSNIYTISKHEKELLEKRKVTYSPEAKDFYVKSEMFYQTIDGKGFTIFMNHKDISYLVNLVVYKDGRVTCYNSSFEFNYDLSELEQLFRNGTFFTDFNTPTEIVLDNFAKVTLEKGLYATEQEDKYKELIDLYSELNDKKTSLEKCREAYYRYLEYPSDYSREKLKELYELIPEHERRYLGDMDSKDSDYVRIIYRPEDKREV
ncbi:DUF7638 domain-containing protein [Paenibacillus elgii]|uniref:DUF7638 domain-containing protein n=1 Tax=Paenibacillus elgii TaxID=189691 RepID=UPI000FD6A09C|nr:hypothetical protein [Paenibacillus elgii]NEN86903.1 hypothetical protein [Paenibacillus elgii]